VGASLSFTQKIIKFTKLNQILLIEMLHDSLNIFYWS